MHCQSISGKQHLPFHNTIFYLWCFGSNHMFALLIFNVDIIAVLEVYVLIY